MKITSREPISRDVTYQLPVTGRELLGTMPRDYFDQNPNADSPYVPCQNGACQNLPREVWRDQLLVDGQGQPVMRTVTRHIEARPADPTFAFLGWGAGGAVGGAIAGALIGSLYGQPGLGAVAMGLVSGLALGGFGAHRASQDRVALVWDDQSAIHRGMIGYEESVRSGRLDGRDGYYHTFTPRLEREAVAAYRTPRVVHYREGETPK
ncbi:MAG: hypothetical protein AB7S38_16635 [Vulcanimicrobiota bacterium]